MDIARVPGRKESVSEMEAELWNEGSLYLR